MNPGFYREDFSIQIFGFRVALVTDKTAAEIGLPINEL
jgi:hypothetical protein